MHPLSTSTTSARKLQMNPLSSCPPSARPQNSCELFMLVDTFLLVQQVNKCLQDGQADKLTSWVYLCNKIMTMVVNVSINEISTKCYSHPAHCMELHHWIVIIITTSSPSPLHHHHPHRIVAIPAVSSPSLPCHCHPRRVVTIPTTSLPSPPHCCHPCCVVSVTLSSPSSCCHCHCHCYPSPDDNAMTAQQWQRDN
jgi:hypothetical protein